MTSGDSKTRSHIGGGGRFRFVEKRKHKSAATILIRLDVDPAAVTLDNASTDRQADARTWVFLLRVQPLKDDEDTVTV